MVNVNPIIYYVYYYIWQIIIYVPFFIIFFYLYYYSRRSVWRGKFIDSLMLANGWGGLFFVIISFFSMAGFRPDIVTVVSILIMMFEAFWQKFTIKPQKISKKYNKSKS